MSARKIGRIRIVTHDRIKKMRPALKALPSGADVPRRFGTIVNGGWQCRSFTTAATGFAHLSPRSATQCSPELSSLARLLPSLPLTCVLMTWHCTNQFNRFPALTHQKTHLVSGGGKHSLNQRTIACSYVVHGAAISDASSAHHSSNIPRRHTQSWCCSHTTAASPVHKHAAPLSGAHPGRSHGLPAAV